VRAAYDLTAEDEASLRLPGSGEIVSAEMAACSYLAEQGPCILVDRFAPKALEGTDFSIPVFIHADFEYRSTRYADENGMGPAAARRQLKRQDRVRERFCRQFSKGWGSAGNYLISVNATDVSEEELAQQVLNALIPVEDGRDKRLQAG